ncbi:MAG: capsular polysaccharide synthesis protein [Treponema sp.]|nr:capsular polysaccharide synthesis protein [Treponema sp.]
MNYLKLKKLNHDSLILSKCFYKAGWFAPGRWLGYFRQKRTLPFLEQIGKELLDKEYSYDGQPIPAEELPIFFMWFQGENELPEVIQKCLESIRKNIPNRKVIIITRENITQYSALPDYILQKVDDGSITKTFFSDIARAALLYKNGGTWADAAIFLTKEVPSSYFEKSYYCPSGIISEHKKDFRYLFNGTKGWNVSFQGTNQKGFPLYDFLFHFYCKYFSEYNTHVDYFMNDYMMSLFCKHNQTFYNLLQNQDLNNQREFDLALMMNKKLTSRNQEKLEELLKDNFIHKLTYRKNWKPEKNGKKTIYSLFINQD